MGDIIHIKAAEAAGKYKSEHEGYEYLKRELVPKGYAEQCAVSLYELPPGKSAYPYHYHTRNEETFYLISGTGSLRTPSGDRKVSAGDFIYFPADESGAHKLTNTSESDLLVYLDFDTHNQIDVAFYPDSGKLGVWGKNTNQLYRVSDRVDYYEGE